MIRQDIEVIQRLAERTKSKSKDKYKIGMIVEGGGMRGVFAGGVMTGLQELGITDEFDVLYGSSSGSCACAYFLSGQAKEGTSVYYDKLSGSRFINILKLRNAMNMAYLRDIFRNIIPLDVKKLAANKTLMKIFVADADTGRAGYYTNKDNVDLVDAMWASCAIPGLMKEPVKVGNDFHLDGNVSKKLPIEDAITDCCTDLLVVTNVPESYRETSYTPLSILKKLAVANMGNAFKETHKKRQENYNECLEILFGGKKVYRKINIYTISPDYVISQAETRRNKLYETAEHGVNKIKKAFGGSL